MRVITDTKGCSLAALYSEAHINERKQLLQLPKALSTRKIGGMILEADLGYTFTHVQEQILRRGNYLAIRQRGRRQVGQAPKVSTRWKIERTFSNLKQYYKRFGHRWEKKQQARQSVVSLVVILLFKNFSQIDS